MRLAFAGTPEVALPSLDALIASRHDVVAVITRPDAPSGRGRRMESSPVALRAREAGIELLTPARPRDEDFLARLGELDVDVCPVVAYGALVPRTALDVPKVGWVNLHFSLLPAWRGAAPVQHAVIAGDEVTGACTFLLEEGLDTGPVYGVVTESIGPRDTSGDLLGRLATSGADLLVRTIDGIEDGTLVPRAQPTDGVSLAPKITVDDARIDWKMPAIAIDRLVRGCSPSPGAWTTWDGERVKVGSVLPVDAPEGVPDLSPGQVHVGRGRALVGTGSRALVSLESVQPPGKRMMAVRDWLNGARIESGESFD